MASFQPMMKSYVRYPVWEFGCLVDKASREDIHIQRKKNQQGGYTTFHLLGRVIILGHTPFHSLCNRAIILQQSDLLVQLVVTDADIEMSCVRALM